MPVLGDCPSCVTGSTAVALRRDITEGASVTDPRQHCSTCYHASKPEPSCPGQPFPWHPSGSFLSGQGGFGDPQGDGAIWMDRQHLPCVTAGSRKSALKPEPAALRFSGCECPMTTIQVSS
jgi:hypothetical protein